MYDSRMEPKQHGGARRNAGRKTEKVGLPTKPVSVSLDEMTVRKLKAVGGGNLSRGIRLAADLAYERFQRSD